MKRVKQMLGMVIGFCIMFSLGSMKSHAASGVVTFSDPKTKTGSEFTINANVRTGGAPIGDGFLTLSYDPKALEFISGKNATGGKGTVELKATGDGQQNQLDYSMRFKALKEGTHKVTVSSYTAYLYSDAKLVLTLGDSTVKVEGKAGEKNSSSDTEDEKNEPLNEEETLIKVGKKMYRVSSDFSDALIPAGYVKTQTNIDGKKHVVVKKEIGDTILVYLVNTEDSNDKDFFYSNQDDGSFVRTEQVEVSNGNTILLLQTRKGVKLPSKFEKTEFEYDGRKFPAWQEPEQVGFCLVNAIDTRGQRSLYQVDVQDSTFQRYVLSQADQQPAKSLGGRMEKIFNWLHDHIEQAIVGLWLFVVLVVLLIIVLSTKLRNRNKELDELYDRYGLDELEANYGVSTAKKVKKDTKRKKPVNASRKTPKYQKPKQKPKNDLELEFDGFEDDFFEPEYHNRSVAKKPEKSQQRELFVDFDTYENFDQLEHHQEVHSPSSDNQDDIDIDFIRLD